MLFKTSRMDFKDLYDDLHNLTPATGLNTILDVMEENNTVYAVEESEKGMTLTHYLSLRSRTLTPAEARTLLPVSYTHLADRRALLSALHPGRLHPHDRVHRHRDRR